MNSGANIYLHLEEQAGIKRIHEPVTIGLPFPQGMVSDSACLTLWDASGCQLPLQEHPLANWFDDSVKWVLLDFQASIEARARLTYQIRCILDPLVRYQSPSLSVQESAEQIVVDTGKVTFFVNRQLCKPFDRVIIRAAEVIATQGSSFVLTDDRGERYFPHISDVAVETKGPLRVTIRARGEMQSTARNSLARFVVRLSFHAGSGLVQMQMTLHNPKAAHHPGGLWDLGDPGSIYFKDLSLQVPLRTMNFPHISWTAQPLQPLKEHVAAGLVIYQDSSGGENWRSTNHVDRFGKVMQSFRGYKISSNDSLLEEGLRATPVVGLHGDNGGMAATIDKFWQNFPKAMEAHGDELNIRLFPRQYNDVFELQGGEQKTHTIYLQFSGPEEKPADLGWVHDRLVPRATPEWYANSKGCLYLSPLSQDTNVECRELIDDAISGSQSFFARREIIDEYGWRHFGDLYADHEAVGHSGETPLVAHYNNQYDVIYGAIIQYLRNGDRRWFELAGDLARHVIDIDIYHTEEDRPAYNGGLFWHTDHYLDAGTATHRAYSKAALTKRDARSYGGGPSNEHNYTSGLLLYYFLTGDKTSREAVLSLADWVINMDDGSNRTLGFVDGRPTGMASSTASRDYHGPGRGAGNSINALLDAYTPTQEARYIDKAEELIRRCIHPKDDIAGRNLDDPEHRWSYLVFLQAVGKYLDHKALYGAYDHMYGYAQASLLHYAGWMLDHEVPYSTVLHKVEIPTETWPAQDIRKCVVFHLAEKHSVGSMRVAFREKADYFFNACIKDLTAFPSHTLTRPLVLLMTNAYVHAYFQRNPEDAAVILPKDFIHDSPRAFKPQFAELYRFRDWIVTARRLLESGLRRIGRSGRKRQISFGVRDG